MLILVGGPLVALRVELPDALSTVFELCVGAMLIYLGVRGLREARQKTTPGHGHDHARARRPFAIGMMHGLAGSGALAALMAIGSPSTTDAITCLALYAFGTVFGMVGLALLAGPLLARAGRFGPALCRVSAIVSIGVGVAWTIRTLVS